MPPVAAPTALRHTHRSTKVDGRCLGVSVVMSIRNDLDSARGSVRKLPEVSGLPQHDARTVAYAMVADVMHVQILHRIRTHRGLWRLWQDADTSPATGDCQ